MPINNEGRLLLSEVLSRQVDTDWPVANTNFDLFVQDLTAGGAITANSFASTGIGVPTIESATNINLSANGANGGAVVIQNSPLRLRGYTDDDIANLTPTAGDLIFNSSNTSIQFYSGNAWLTLSIS